MPLRFARQPVYFCVWVTLLALSITVEAPRAQGLETVKVDLNSKKMGGEVPFDVEFRVMGKIPLTVRTVEGFWTRLERGETDTTYVAGDPRWMSMGAWDRIPLSQADSFALYVPPLPPSGRFLFHFVYTRAPTDDEVNAFQAVAAVNLGRALTRLPVGGAEYDTIRAALVRAVPPVTSPLVVVVKPGSVFDTTLAVGGANQRAVEAAVGSVALLRTPQTEFDGVLKAWGTDGQPTGALYDAQRSAERTLSDPLLTLVGSAVSTVAAGTPSFSDLAGPARSASALGSLDGQTRERVVAGSAPLEGPVPAFPIVAMGLVSEPADLVGRIQNLQATSSALRGVRSLLRRIAIDEALRQADPRIGALGPGELVGLEARLDTLEAEHVARLLNLAQRAERALRLRQERISATVAALTLVARERISVRGSTTGSFATRADWYLSGDFGLAHIPAIETVTPYAGVNIYFRPVNKEAPLRGGQFLRRFSLMLGVTRSIAADGERSDLFGETSLLAGAGVRLTDYLRLSGGALAFQDVEDEEGPSIDVRPFWSLSFDIDVKGLLGDLGTAIAK